MKLFEIEYYHANNDKLFVMHINAEDKRDAMLKFNKMQKKNKDIVVVKTITKLQEVKQMSVALVVVLFIAAIFLFKMAAEAVTDNKKCDDNCGCDGNRGENCKCKNK